MKKQLLSVWCGLASMFTTFAILNFAVIELRIESLPGLSAGGISIITGILGGLVTEALSSDKASTVLLVPLLGISFLWLLAFPTPNWQNVFLWNWPMWGILAMWLTVFIKENMLRKNQQ